jgi:hypothetical protein
VAFSLITDEVYLLSGVHFGEWRKSASWDRAPGSHFMTRRRANWCLMLIVLLEFLVTRRTRIATPRPGRTYGVTTRELWR